MCRVKGLGFWVLFLTNRSTGNVQGLGLGLQGCRMSGVQPQMHLNHKPQRVSGGVAWNLFVYSGLFLEVSQTSTCHKKSLKKGQTRHFQKGLRNSPGLWGMLKTFANSIYCCLLGRQARHRGLTFLVVNIRQHSFGSPGME